MLHSVPQNGYEITYLKKRTSTWEVALVLGMLNDVRRKEENNRMGKTRDLFKKTGDTKGILHAKMGSVKDRNSKDLTETEEIKKKWQEYTKNYTKNILMTQINTIMWSFT